MSRLKRLIEDIWVPAVVVFVCLSFVFGVLLALSSAERQPNVYNEGRKAALNGIPETACPYSESEFSKRKQWLYGWIDVKVELYKGKDTK